MDTITLEEIEFLPRWAQVAFAARCARRSLNSIWQSAEVELYAMANTATQAAELAASKASLGAGEDAIHASNDVAVALEGTLDDHIPSAVSNAVYAADRAIGAALAFGLLDDFSGATRQVSAAYEASCKTVDNQGAKTARLEYEMLRLATNREHWGDDTPIPIDFFGPISPAVELYDLTPCVASQSLYLEVDAPANANDEEIQRLISEAASRANALHMAYGGNGLKVDDLQVWQPAGVPVEVGQ